VEKNCKECKVIHRGVDCGRGYVARCAQIDILTKCRRGCSEEREKVEEVKFRRENGGNSSRREVIGVFTEISGRDSFQREMNDSRPSDMGESYGG
jgi:hypothetical protein